MDLTSLYDIANRLDNLGLGAEEDGDGVRAYGLAADWLPLLARMENPITLEDVERAVREVLDSYVARMDGKAVGRVYDNLVAQNLAEVILTRLKGANA